MKFWNFLTITGILTLVVYGISRTVTASRLIYLIQNAQENNSQLALLVTVSNNQGLTFQQKNVNADVIVNGQVVSKIFDQSTTAIQPYQVTPQAWVLSLTPDQIPGGSLQLIRIRGTVDIDGLTTPLDLKYKFI
jgi:hypothetical protein